MNHEDIRYKCERCSTISLIRNPPQAFCEQQDPKLTAGNYCRGELRKVKITEKEVRPEKVRRFKMIRHNDESGISGKGHILDGIVFHNGWVVTCWRTDTADKHGSSCITYWENYEAFYNVHIKAHPANNTEIQWYDCEVIRTKDEE